MNWWQTGGYDPEREAPNDIRELAGKVGSQITIRTMSPGWLVSWSSTKGAVASNYQELANLIAGFAGKKTRVLPSVSQRTLIDGATTDDEPIGPTFDESLPADLARLLFRIPNRSIPKGIKDEVDEALEAASKGGLL